ncbi:alkaline phosphatase-like protein [Byssothecium circinans]|uniref:Alkaline phosphatase-like protein n=1 Tax=Byssothecium circinans TaxID=147558 RepID=A0A6A5UHZ8_9PLEO|nr:alkaline phosphatase-like protein [Byssothecium circinans]
MWKAQVPSGDPVAAEVLMARANNANVTVKLKPNIVFIFTDDQDYHANSLDSMKALQEELVEQGTLFTNHYATVTVCCRVRLHILNSIGQQSLTSTNRGGYGKFAAAKEDDDYLPHWLNKAGYRTEYVGKLLNGNNMVNYNPAPKGWGHIDCLLDPYTNVHNSVVMSENGARPKWYRGYQQTDVVRIKACISPTLCSGLKLKCDLHQSLARLETLVKEDDPFFLMIAPTAPHVENIVDPPTPPARYFGSFPNMTTPRTPNWNPKDDYQKSKPSWVGKLPLMNQTGRGNTEIQAAPEGDAGQPGLFSGNDYKTMRVVSKKSSWMYSRWCTHDTELYNTTEDPYELTNLANSTDPAIKRVMMRMNALLLVGKSCTQDTCCKPWSVLQSPNASSDKPVETLDDSLDPKYDEYYASFPQVNIKECLTLLETSNERPYYPPDAEKGFG